MNLILISLLFISCNEGTKPTSEQHVFSVTESNRTVDLDKKTNNRDFKNNSTTEINKIVLSIFQDRNDNYWFGTNAGAYRFDGKSLILFTTKDGLFQNQIQEIQEDLLGNIYFGTGGFGVSVFDGKGFVSLQAKEYLRQKSPSKNNWKIEQGDLWFNAGGGAFRYYKDSLTYLPFPPLETDSKYSPHPAYQFSAYGVYSTMKDRRGNLWFGTQAMGVCRYDGKSFTWFTEKGLRGPAVLALFEDRNGIIWFGNNGKGLFRYDGTTLTNVTEEKGLSNPEFIKSGKVVPGTLARVWAINEDNNGNLFIGTGDAGVWRYDGRNLINYSTTDGLPFQAVETIYKDKKGELWFGTNGEGVYKFNGKIFTKFTIQ